MNKLNGIKSQHHEFEEDPTVALALQHFRDSIHAWSEAELSQPRAVTNRVFFWAIRRPALNWAAASIMALTAVSIPLAYRYEASQQQKHEAFVLEQQKIASEAAARQQAYAVDDEDLLRHVDSDIAQATPDAMEPLASLMSDSTATR